MRADLLVVDLPPSFLSLSAGWRNGMFPAVRKQEVGKGQGVNAKEAFFPENISGIFIQSL